MYRVGGPSMIYSSNGKGKSNTGIILSSLLLSLILMAVGSFLIWRKYFSNYHRIYFDNSEQNAWLQGNWNATRQSKYTAGSTMLPKGLTKAPVNVLSTEIESKCGHPCYDDDNCDSFVYTWGNTDAEKTCTFYGPGGTVGTSTDSIIFAKQQTNKKK
jgi:hypothetical protein